MHNQNRENVLYPDWLILLYCISKETCSFAFPEHYHLLPGQYHLPHGQDQKYCVGAFESMASSATRPGWYIFNQSCSSSFFTGPAQLVGQVPYHFFHQRTRFQTYYIITTVERAARARS